MCGNVDINTTFNWLKTSVDAVALRISFPLLILTFKSIRIIHYMYVYIYVKICVYNRIDIHRFYICHTKHLYSHMHISSVLVYKYICI